MNLYKYGIHPLIFFLYFEKGMDGYTIQNCFANNYVDHAVKVNSNLKFRAFIYRKYILYN